MCCRHTLPARLQAGFCEGLLLRCREPPLLLHQQTVLEHLLPRDHPSYVNLLLLLRCSRICCSSRKLQHRVDLSPGITRLQPLQLTLFSVLLLVLATLVLTLLLLLVLLLPLLLLLLLRCQGPQGYRRDVSPRGTELQGPRRARGSHTNILLQLLVPLLLVPLLR